MRWARGAAWPRHVRISKRIRCAISNLPDHDLLDAAHIMADAHELLGQPVLPNGIALSKVHHAAFDRHLIGIDPDGRVHVSERLLMLHEGPLLEQSLKAIAGGQIRLPTRREDRPDRNRLAIRSSSSSELLRGGGRPSSFQSIGLAPMCRDPTIPGGLVHDGTEHQ